MIQLFNGFGSFGFLLSERNVFIVELLKDVSRELAPKLWEKVACGKELGIFLFIYELVEWGKSSNCHYIIEYIS